MGKIVVKKIQSQASNTPFTIPSSDGSANQVIKTDGSANLGWTDKTSSIASNSGIDYKMPSADGTAGQYLKTTDANGTLAFGTASQMPLSTPDGNHQSWRLCDKYFFGLNNGANASSVQLTVPASYTTDPTKVLKLRIEWFGNNRGSTNSSGNYIKFQTFSQNGSTVNRKNSNTMAYGNISYYWNQNNYANYGYQGTTASGGNGEAFHGAAAGPSGQGTADYNANTIWDGSSGTASATGETSAFFMHWEWANNKGWPCAYEWGQVNYGANGSGRAAIPYSGCVRSGNSTNKYHSSASSAEDHTMSVKLDFPGSLTIRDGNVSLYALFKDGVVS